MREQLVAVVRDEHDVLQPAAAEAVPVAPRLDGDDVAGEELLAGDVIAVEPGCYRIGFGGCRLEDLVLVTEDGYELLTSFPHDLVV